MSTIVKVIRKNDNTIKIEPVRFESGETVIWRVMNAKDYALKVTLPVTPNSIDELIAEDYHDVSTVVGVARTEGSDLEDSYQVSLTRLGFNDPVVLTATSTLVIERGIEPPDREPSRPHCDPHGEYSPNASFLGAAGAPDRP